MVFYKKDYNEMVKEMAEKLVELSVKHKDSSIVDVFAPTFMSYSTGIEDIVQQRMLFKPEYAETVKEDIVASIMEKIEERLFDLGLNVEEGEE